MIEFTERIGAEPKIFPGVSMMTVTEDKPKKKDDDGDAAFGKTSEHEDDRANKEDVSD